MFQTWSARNRNARNLKCLRSAWNLKCFKLKRLKEEMFETWNDWNIKWRITRLAGAVALTNRSCHPSWHMITRTAAVLRLVSVSVHRRPAECLTYHGVAYKPICLRYSKSTACTSGYQPQANESHTIGWQMLRWRWLADVIIAEFTNTCKFVFRLACWGIANASKRMLGRTDDASLQRDDSLYLQGLA